MLLNPFEMFHVIQLGVCSPAEVLVMSSGFKDDKEFQ